MIDVASWKESFSAGNFYDLAISCIYDIHSRGKVPLLVGGTGFYMNWLLRGKPKGPPTTPEIMDQVIKELDGKSWNECFELLKNVDPEYSASLVPNDFYRLQRAFAIYKMTGKKLSEFLPSKNLETTDHSTFFLNFFIPMSFLERLNSNRVHYSLEKMNCSNKIK